MKIGIIGLGSFGLSLSRHFALKNPEETITVWGYSIDEVEMFNTNKQTKYLKNIVFPNNIYATNSLKEAVEDKDIIIHVTPSAFAKDIHIQYSKYLKEDAYVVICSKGFDKTEETILYNVFKKHMNPNNIGVLTGPTHAEEISQNIKSAIIIASENDKLRKQIVKLFDTNIVRVYESNDIIGAEIGGALKNIIAFCAGICVELKQGDNTFAALCTRGLVEISRFAVKLGGKEKTIYGLSGLGDLIVTCSSMHSRNRRAGMLLAKGLKKDEIEAEIGMVVESIQNLEIAKKIADKIGVEMPILNAVYSVVFENVQVEYAISKLMNRTLREE